MVEMTDVRAIPPRTHDARIISLVSSAHFVAHVYALVLPPLFVFVKRDYDVSYADLGMALAVFSIISMVFQTPAGFLSDRIGAGRLLIAGLLGSAAGVFVAGLGHGYWSLVAGFAIMGLANTVYHPANYAILSHAIGMKRIGQAFSIHTFAGTLGGAVAPTMMLFLANIWSWHAALIGASVIGAAVAFVLIVYHHALDDGTRRAPVKRNAAEPAATGQVGWRLLFSGPILRNLAFFFLLSMNGACIQGFTIVALGALYGTSLRAASIILTFNLIFNAIGVLAGGVVVTRIRHYRVATISGFMASGLLLLLIAFFDMPLPLLALVMATSGFLGGIIQPSRDMIVRSIAPPGSYGKVFGFVTTGFNLAGAVAPLLFGYLMDQSMPRSVFILGGILAVLALPLVFDKQRAPRAA